jgi:hypothetical protein
MIDPKKTYRTRDGREVRIYAMDGALPYSVHGAVKHGDSWISKDWADNGGFLTPHCETDPLDLIEVRPRIQREVWVNVYPDHVGMVCETKEEADNATGAKSRLRIACVKLVIDCEEGEGL